MTVFNEYAEFYDMLYRNKDYTAECDFLESIFRQHGKKSINKILDTGCGTGGHAFSLSQRGYTITGVDFSDDMLKIAKEKAQASNLDVQFKKEDIRNFNLKSLFDAVISMFAVIGYQTENEDVVNVFRNIRKHLNPSGLFVFDFWFGPAVLTLKPSDRMKTIQEENYSIIRFASPKIDILKQWVEVKYTILKIHDNSALSKTNETHIMRYFYPQEIDYLLKANGFELIKLCPFLELDRLPSEQDWNVTAIARAV